MVNILFRTAGGKETKQELGLGHIYRCLNLAKELKPNKINFLLEDFGGARRIIEQKGFKNIKSLKKNIQLIEDIKITKKNLEEKKIDLLIVDRYHMKLNYLKIIKKYVKLVVISDLYNTEYPADLVVNGFVGFKNEIKVNSYNSKCLLGPKYQIIDKRFCEKTKNMKQKYDLLITVGGYDEKNIIDKILKVIESHISKIKIKVIVGPIGKKSNFLKNLEKKYPKNLKIIKFTKNMKKEIEETKFGICNGGITSYEFATMKKPFGIICVENHQLKTASEWEKKGSALNFGIMTEYTKIKIKEFLDKIIDKKSPFVIKNKKLVDAKGVLRVVNEILKIK